MDAFAYLCEGSTYLLSDESQLESPIITVKASLCVQLHPWPLTLFILYHTKGILMFISLLHWREKGYSYVLLRTLGRKGSTVKSQRLFAIRHYLHKKAKSRKSVYFYIGVVEDSRVFFWKVGKQNNISHKNFASTYFSICGLFCAIKE